MADELTKTTASNTRDTDTIRTVLNIAFAEIRALRDQAELGKRLQALDIEALSVRVAERLDKPKGRGPLPIDQLDFETLTLALNVANARAAKASLEMGRVPAGDKI